MWPAQSKEREPGGGGGGVQRGLAQPAKTSRCLLLFQELVLNKKHAMVSSMPSRTSSQNQSIRTLSSESIDTTQSAAEILIIGGSLRFQIPSWFSPRSSSHPNYIVGIIGRNMATEVDETIKRIASHKGTPARPSLHSGICTEYAPSATRGN